MQYPGVEQNISGWGGYPKMKSRVLPIYSTETIALSGQSLIPRGLGRSYGDSALNEIVADITPLDRFLVFDDSKGLLHCQAGVSLGEILSIIVPKGWFLPVIPGTKFVTMGGAVAADIHGKNHHVAGSFCDYVKSLNIFAGTREIIYCTPKNNSDLFHATCGGMGLTGIILDVCIKLKPIKSKAIIVKTIKTTNLENTLEIIAENNTKTYSVAWIDCLKKGENMGRSVLRLGEHSNIGVKSLGNKFKLNIPFKTPSFLLNKYLFKSFNSIYYHRHFRQSSENTIYYEPFFFPLDAIKNWNRLYGKNGFFQYQFVIPFSAGFDGMKKIMNEITNCGLASFLAVIKTLGKQNNNFLSFPLEGYTLALDIKYSHRALEHFENLDKIIIDMGGRIYLAKDARMSEHNFKRSYKNWEKFQAVRKKYGAINVFSSLQSKRLGLD